MITAEVSEDCVVKQRADVAVVVLNWNSFERTANSIYLLCECSILPTDIFVVDNGSTDDSASAIKKRFPMIDITCNKDNLGFGGGCNVAIRKILSIKNSYMTFFNADCYKYILLFNTDAGIEKKSLDVLVEILEGNISVGVVGPVIVRKDDEKVVLAAGGLDPSLYINTYDRRFQFEVGKGHDKYFPVYYVSGTVALLRTQVVFQAGLFEEEYFFSCEMADLCEKIKAIGYECAVSPEAKSWHDIDVAGGKRSTLYLYYILRNRFLFIRKFKRKYMFLLFSYWIVLSHYFALKALCSRKVMSARAIFLALKDGLLGRYGGRNNLFDLK